MRNISLISHSFINKSNKRKNSDLLLNQHLISINFCKMNFIDEALLIQEHQLLQLSLQQRKQALLIQLKCVDDPQKDLNLIQQLLRAQNQSILSRCHSLLQDQSSKLIQKQINMEIERFEKRVFELRSLLASKEQEICFQRDNGKSTRRYRPIFENISNLNHQNKLKKQLYQQFLAKSILQREIVALQNEIGNQQIKKRQMGYSTKQLDTTIIKIVVKEEQQSELLKQQLNQSEQLLLFQILRNKQALLRYKELNNRLIDEHCNKMDKQEVKSGQSSNKNISQTSDED